MQRFSIDLLAPARRWAQFATGTQRVIECDQQDGALVTELLNAQGWSTEAVASESGRTGIRIQRGDVTGDDSQAKEARYLGLALGGGFELGSLDRALRKAAADAGVVVVPA